jgi:hypothetical protein
MLTRQDLTAALDAGASAEAALGNVSRAPGRRHRAGVVRPGMGATLCVPGGR